METTARLLDKPPPFVFAVAVSLQQLQQLLREKRSRQSFLLSITGGFFLKKQTNWEFSFGPLLYPCSVSEVFHLLRIQAEAVSSLQTPGSGFKFINFKVVFLCTFQKCLVLL